MEQVINFIVSFWVVSLRKKDLKWTSIFNEAMWHNEYIIPPLKPQNLYRMERVTHPSLQGAVLNDVIHLDAVVTDV